MKQLTAWAFKGTSKLGRTLARKVEAGRPRSRAKDQQRRDCHVCEAMRQPMPVAMIMNSRKIAPPWLLRAWEKSSRMGTPVAVVWRVGRSVRLKNILTLKNQEVTKPIATVPMIAMGIIFSGRATSSAMCVAQSRQANAQFVLISPTMKAMPFCFQPVLLRKLAKTNLAGWWWC